VSCRGTVQRVGPHGDYFNVGNHVRGRVALRVAALEGGARERKVELAEAERRAAEEESRRSRSGHQRDLEGIHDVRLGFRRLDVARALVKASESSYEAVLRSYRWSSAPRRFLAARSRAERGALPGGGDEGPAPRCLVTSRSARARWRLDSPRHTSR